MSFKYIEFILSPWAILPTSQGVTGTRQKQNPSRFPQDFMSQIATIAGINRYRAKKEREKNNKTMSTFITTRINTPTRTRYHGRHICIMFIIDFLMFDVTETESTNNNNSNKL